MTILVYVVFAVWAIFFIWVKFTKRGKKWFSDHIASELPPDENDEFSEKYR